MVNKNAEADRFTLAFQVKSLSFYMEGTLAADMLVGKPLDTGMLRSFVETSAECQEYLKSWNTGSLLKIKTTVEAYLVTTFPAHTFDKMCVSWVNGEDKLSLTS